VNRAQFFRASENKQETYHYHLNLGFSKPKKTALTIMMNEKHSLYRGTTYGRLGLSEDSYKAQSESRKQLIIYIRSLSYEGLEWSQKLSNNN